ncbi:hypothetical protein BS47DRAFT_1374076 [Hydnum rufescens UP504]|uniref:CxC2-like cysteine cluster KDZ transposase-associated domain-containing protein n=1 Tax=Hydnum rufescens UP504 TaxID=1448309 RepID=A0A9P6AIS0_9AGAM|nr:hypothetical protein BS47DRAFT_1374076 [Hydnum rufescens UP504]
MPSGQEIYEPSNPNHHQIGALPKTSGNKCYAAAINVSHASYVLWESGMCATFVALNHFHLQTIHSKLTTTHFIAALECETDNTGLVTVKDQYVSFLQMLCEWHHLMMLKRAGCGHEDSGVKGMQPGALAILCLACPHPGINLPNDWKSAPTSQQFLYGLHIAADANFRMKNCFKSGSHPDVGLGTGLSYFIEDAPYKSFLLNYVSETDISTCSSLAALDLANTWKSVGLHITGVGAAVCARQGCIHPLGLGDLQKGEYCNMDYIIFSGLQSCGLHEILLSYNIFCQWAKKQEAHHDLLPVALQLDPQITLLGVVPKFHLPAHKDICHMKYSLNLCPGCGRTDGEGIEHDWSNINPTAMSMKEMGSGSRHGTIDDLFRDWNYCKNVGLGEWLMECYNWPDQLAVLSRCVPQI